MPRPSLANSRTCCGLISHSRELALVSKCRFAEVAFGNSSGSRGTVRNRSSRAWICSDGIYLPICVELSHASSIHPPSVWAKLPDVPLGSSPLLQIRLGVI